MSKSTEEIVTQNEPIQTNIDDLLSQNDVKDFSVEKKQEEESELEKIQEENISLQKKKLDEVEQSVSKRKGKKSKILNIVFFIVNIAVVVGILLYQLGQEDLEPISGINFNIGSLFILIGLIALVIICETSAVSYLLKQSTGKWKWGTAYKVAEIGKYYDNVTPMATGGQTFQIAYLKSHGTPIHTALSIPLAKYVFGQLAWVVTSFICLVVSWTDSSYGTFVSIASILGFVLGFIMLFIVIFLSVCKTVGKKLVVKSLKLLYKMKIVKNYDKQYEKITKYISDFQDVMKQYARSPKDFLIMMFISLARNVINYSMPFFIVKFFVSDLSGDMYIKLFVMTCLVDLSSSFFPLPGGTGLNEISFTSAFSAVVAQTTLQSSILAWVLIFWRMCSYYIYLLQGVIVLSYDFVYGNKKYKWSVIRENLVQESEVFKQEQINKFRNDRLKRRKSKNKSGLKEYL